MEFILENYHPLHFRIRDKQGLNNNAGGDVGLGGEKYLLFWKKWVFLNLYSEGFWIY